MATNIWALAKKNEFSHVRLLEGSGSPYYKIFNDNRYEQHSWLWKHVDL